MYDWLYGFHFKVMNIKNHIVPIIFNCKKKLSFFFAYYELNSLYTFHDKSIFNNTYAPLVHGNSQCIPKKPGGHVQSPVTGSQPCGQPQNWRQPSPYFWYGQSFEQPKLWNMKYMYLYRRFLVATIQGDILWYRISLSRYHYKNYLFSLYFKAIQLKFIIIVILVVKFFPQKHIYARIFIENKIIHITSTFNLGIRNHSLRTMRWSL